MRFAIRFAWPYANQTMPLRGLWLFTFFAFESGFQRSKIKKPSRFRMVGFVTPSGCASRSVSLGLTQISSAHFVGCGLFHLSALTSELVTPPNKKAPRLRRRAL
jgi:hypothetical protein